MRSIEEQAIIAALDNDEAAARRLVGDLLPGERNQLRAACVVISHLCAGDVTLPELASAESVLRSERIKGVAVNADENI